MAAAIRHLAPRYCEQLVVVLQSYARLGLLVELSIERVLATLGLDYADVLLLGWHNRPPAPASSRLSCASRPAGVDFVGISPHCMEGVTACRHKRQPHSLSLDEVSL